MTRPSCALAAGALVFMAAANASAGDLTVTAYADTYVKRDNSGPRGSESVLGVRNSGSSDSTLKALVEFHLTETTHAAFESSLALDLASLGGGSFARFNVFGIDWRTAECFALLWQGLEDARYNDATLGYLNDSDDGVNNSSPCIYGGAALGQFTGVDASVGGFDLSNVGETVEFTGPALDAYLREVALQGGRAVFLITRADKGDHKAQFASREHPTLQPPRLSWTNRDGFVFEGSQPAPSKSSTQTQQWTGDLKVPMGGGKYIRLTGADVEVKYVDGVLDSLHGTVGAIPELDGMGLLSQLDFTGAALEIGWGRPSTFGMDGGILSPLNQDLKYAYLRVTSGFGVSAGPVSFEAVEGGEMFLAFDPVSQTVYGYTDAIPQTGLPIEAAAVGLSGRKGLRFEPIYNEGVTGKLTAFDANAYVAAVAGYDLGGDGGSVGFGLTLTGESFVEADLARFTPMSVDWMKRVGFNGEAAVSASFGPASVEMTVGEASMRIDDPGRSNRMVALAGVAQSPDMPAWMPLQFGSSSARIAAVFDQDEPSSSFLRLSGTFTPIHLPGEGTVSLKGDVKLAATGVKAEVTASIAGQSTTLKGDIDVNDASVQLDGELELKASQSGWSFEIEFDPRLKLSPNGPSIDLRNRKAKACGKVGEVKECVSTASIKTFDFIDDKLKVCVSIPLIGTKCETWKP